MKLKLVVLLTLIISTATIVYCQVALPSGGAIEVLRKEDFAVDLLCWLVAILSAIVVYLYLENKKLKDSTIKDLKEQLMRHENK